MKLQLIVSILPLLAPLIAAFPAAEPDANVAPSDFNATEAVIEVLPDFTPDDEETPANIADDELAVEASSSLPTVAELDKRAVALPKLTWEHKFSFKRRRRRIAKGDSTITFFRNGNVRFRTHFKALRLISYNYALTCGVRDADGHAYTLTRKGKICGKLRPCSSTHNVDETKHNPKVQRNWNSIKRGPLVMHCEARLRWDFGGLMNAILDALRRAGPIVGPIIKLFVP